MSDSKSRALNVIRSEHRALAAVINNMKAMLAEVQAQRMTMDFPLFWSMVHYIDAFPDTLHHPKEDLWLFDRIEQRTQVANDLIAELRRQHQAEPVALNGIRRALGNLEAGVPSSLSELTSAVGTYADFNWKHLRAEEHELLPIAEANLTPSDWDDLAAAFATNQDPLTGVRADEPFNALFHQIVARTPSPLGLGPSQSN